MPDVDGAHLARQLARAVNGQYHMLSAPLLVTSARVRDALMHDPVMRDVFEHISQIDLALVGIGAVEPRHSALVQAGFISAAESNQLMALGAVGDVCAVHLNLRGAPVAHEVNRRIIGVDPATLRRAPLRLGVAGGAEKGAAILAALRSGMINGLITDEHAAGAVLALAAEKVDTIQP
jgi:DNA-binding transcriptional regulator LsrR (DeoR family)